MNRQILDQATRAKLGNLNERLELCDESGRVLGRYTPTPTPTPDASLYEGVDSPTSVEELRQRELEGGGRELSEILADLERQSRGR